MVGENVFFLVLGVIFGFFANALVVYWQFRGSTAGHRVGWVADATRELETPSKTGPPRSKFRYALGVIIDDLRKMQEDGTKDDGKWPLLAGNKDRWERFNKYVRPVLDDINNYSFLGWKGFFFLPRSRQLRNLAKLCVQIEDVVMRIDAACERPAVAEIIDGGISPIDGVADEDGRLQLLEEGNIELYKAWQRWKNSV